MNSTARIATIFRREFAAYFTSPLAGIFLVIYLFMSAVLTFQMGGLYERGQADLRPFFQVQPWLDLFLVPALSMRLWAEDRRTGTIELLLTLPFSVRDLVLGKFLAAWAFACVALALTAPLWITVAWLGSPDHGTILVGYIASALMAGTFLAIGAFLSAFTKNQVIAFVLAVAVCFLFAVAGSALVTDFLSQRMPVLAEVARALSLTERFNGLTRGVIALRDVVFFASFIGFWLFVNAVVLDHRKAD